MDTKAAVARVPNGDFTVESVSIEAPRAGEVMVAVAGVGLCHTDLIFRDQFAPYALPAILGHEGAGTITAIGEDVTGLAVGDRVVLGFSSCGHCTPCDRGLPSYCQDFPALNYVGFRPEDSSTAYAAGSEQVGSHFFGQSSFAAHAIARARNVVKVTDDAAPLDILGPLGCGLQTGAGGVMRSMACPEGSSIVVAGGGPVGLAAVMGAVIQGCATIALVEPVAARRDLALELGATHVIDPAAGPVADAILTVLPQGADYAFDTTGRIDVIEALHAGLAKLGTIGLVGVPATADAALSVNVVALINAGHRVMGIMEGDSDPQVFIPELIAHHRAGRFPFDKLVKTFPLDRINEAVAAQARGDCVKVVLIP